MGRLKQGWIQSDTARELGISQASVSRVLELATALEICPELYGFEGGIVLKVLSAMRNPDAVDYITWGATELAILQIIARRIGVWET